MGTIKIRIYFILVLSLLLLSTRNSTAQKYSFTNYNVTNGLPSSEVHYAFQDSKGYMWFATDAGVCRFNGYEFKKFDTSDGLTDNTVFYITEDKHNRIWFGTLNCQLSYYQNDSIYPYKYNNLLKDSLTNIRPLIDFNIDEHDVIWMGFLYKGLKKIDADGNFQSIFKWELGKHNIFLIQQKENIFFGESTGTSMINKYTGTSVSYQNLTTNEKKYFEFKDPGKTHAPRLIITDSCSSAFLIKTISDSFYKFNPAKNSFKQLYPPDKLRATTFNQLFWEKEYIYILTNDGAFKCVVHEDSIVIRERFLKEERISRMFRDNEGGYWIQTLENGINYTPSLSIANNNMNLLIDEKEQVSNLAVDKKGNLFFVIEGKGLFVKNKLSGQVKKLLTTKKDHPVHILYDSNLKTTTIYTNDKSYAYQNGKLTLRNHTPDIFSGRTAFVDFPFYYNSGKNFFYVYNLSKKIFTSNGIFSGNTLCKYQNKIWIGADKGIKLYKDKKLTSPFSANKYLSSVITHIKKLNDSTLLIGTKNYGLIILKNDTIADIINETNGIVNNLIRTIHVDDEETIWVGTSTGVSRINYHVKGDYTVYNLTEKQGLSSIDINKIDSYKNMVYLATQKGLKEFDRTNILINKTPPPLHITSFVVNEKAKKISNNNHFLHTENNINIKYEALNYKSLGKIEYQYRLVGTTSKWEVTTARNMRYSALKPGKYIFELKTKNEDGVSSKLISIPFTINPPFWLTRSFLVLTIILIIIILYFIIQYQLQQVNKKNTIEKKIIQLELKALRSQINPHFIFNTLNSIQYYVGENNFKETNIYITKFSMLIRTVLNLSEKGLISIHEEIEMLSLYLDLEKMRFEEQFDYEIVVNNELDVDNDKIPSMLLQPYIENAIWHGLMNISGKGLIKIEMVIENTFLKCTIIDNGIGREKAKEIKSKRKIKHKSLGMNITKERLKLLSNETAEDINVEIIDLYENKNGTNIGVGTKVIVKIPL